MTTKQEKQLKRDLRATALLKVLKRDIEDDFRATEGDTTPGMCVTFGFKPATEDKPFSWMYQTGGNSFYGHSYGLPFWGVVSLHRRSNCRELALDAANEINDSIE